MDNRTEVREFLTSRRAKLTPERAGLTAGSNRRVAGLRRGEVAFLADVSVEYYAKLERGQIAGASDAVLHAVATALHLDDAERAHLFALARAANAPVTAKPRRRGGKATTVRPSLQLVLDTITTGPAFVRNGRMDILATNALGKAFYSEVLESPGRGNLARYNFLDPRAQQFYPDWDAAADVVVAILRTEAGRDPYDRGLQDLVGELSTRSDEFRTRWGAHDVREHGTGVKTLHHPVVGDVTLIYEGFESTADPGLAFLIYSAEAGSASEERLRLLASWAATQSADPVAATAAAAEGEVAVNTQRKAPTSKGPAATFTGDVYVDAIVAPQNGDQRMVVARVRFTPGARTAWHSHARGQTLHITEGVALLGTRDGTVIRATPGDTIYTPPGEEHWHGATPEDFMEHLAMLENADDPATTTTWLEHVTDDQYNH